MEILLKILAMLNSECIKIKCPYDGVLLSVIPQNGLNQKKIMCPVCHNTFMLSEGKLEESSDNVQSETNLKSYGSLTDLDTKKHFSITSGINKYDIGGEIFNIEVVDTPERSIIFIFSSPRLNTLPILVGGCNIERDDKVILHDNIKITLPSCSLVFSKQ